MEMDQKTFIGRISQALGRDSVPEQISDAYDYSQGLQFSRLRGLDAQGLRDQLASQQKVRDFTLFTCDKKKPGKNPRRHHRKRSAKARRCSGGYFR